MAGQRRFDHLGATGQMQAISRAGDAGVQQLATEHAVVAAWQLQPDLVELRALRLVHGHREGALVQRQCRRVEGARVGRVVAGEPGTNAAAITQADADIAVEQTVAVAVLANDQQPAVEPARAQRAAAVAGQQVFDAGVEPARALRAFAYRGEQAHAAGQRQRIGRAGGIGQ